jgi:hypothetical protein
MQVDVSERTIKSREIDFYSEDPRQIKTADKDPARVTRAGSLLPGAG